MSKTPKDENTTTYIYTLSHPITKEIRYVGKTVKPLNIRLNGHIYSIKRENNHRTNWIKNLVKQDLKPIIEVLEICKWKESQDLEIYWIEQLKSWGVNLVNISSGGEGALNVKKSKENIEQIRLRRSIPVYKYSLLGDFIKEYSSATQAAKDINFRSASKIGLAAHGSRGKAGGYLWSFNKVENLPPYKRSKKIISKEHKNILRDKRSIPLYQYDKDENLIKKWDSTKQYAIENDLSYPDVISYLTGNKIIPKIYKTMNNYIWKRKE